MSNTESKQVVVITGATDGLGLAVARRLSIDADIVLTGRNPDKLEAIGHELRAVTAQLDLTDPLTIKSAVVEIMQRFGRIDTVVHCAGQWRQGLVAEHTTEQIGDLFAVNTIGPILLTREVMPIMLSQGGGRLIYVLSRDARYAKRFRSVYHATKWGLEGFVQCLRHDVAGTGIGVTAIYPGLMQTQLFQKAGITRETDKALDPALVATEIARITLMPAAMEITELALQHPEEQWLP